MNDKDLLKKLLEIRIIANSMVPEASDQEIEHLRAIIKLTDVAAEEYRKGLTRVVE